MKTLFSDVWLDRRSLFTRLPEEASEALREFARDPLGYINDAFSGTGSSRRRRSLLSFGLALGILTYAASFILVLVFWSLNHHSRTQVEETPPHSWLSGPVISLVPRRPEGEKKPTGGGGGGDETVAPPSGGRLASFSNYPSILAPDTTPPRAEASLPLVPTILVDPRLEPKRDELLPIGMPNAEAAPPADGPGSKNGIGTGEDGGMGEGEGAGLRKGKGRGTGGSEYGGPPAGGPPSAFDRVAVDTRPQLLTHPRPNYTEEARKNKVQGVIRLRILIAADGSVKSVVLSSHLPDGLDEQAVSAAGKLRFVPAKKNGKSIAVWIPLEVLFHLR